MTIGSADFPPDSGDAVDYLPFAAGPSPASIQSSVYAPTAAQLLAIIQNTALGGTGTLMKWFRLTAAQIQSLNTVPVVAIAGVPGAIILPEWYTSYDVRGAVAYSGTPTLNLRWNGIGTNIALDMAMLAGASVTPNTRFSIAEAVAAAGFAQTFDTAGAFAAIGASLMIRSSTDVTGGTGSLMTIGIAYRVIAA